MLSSSKMITYEKGMSSRTLTCKTLSPFTFINKEPSIKIFCGAIIIDLHVTESIVTNSDRFKNMLSVPV